MFSFLAAHAMTAAVVAACVFGWWKGGSAERGGAVLIGGGWIASMLVYSLAILFHSPYAPYVPFAVDGLVGVGFLGLALRYSSAWLGAAMLLQAAALAIHASFLSGDGSSVSLYFARVNLLGIAIIVLFFCATLNAWLRRALAEGRAASEPPASPPASNPSRQGGDGFPRKAFDAAPVAVPHRLIRR